MCRSTVLVVSSLILLVACSPPRCEPSPPRLDGRDGLADEASKATEDGDEEVEGGEGAPSEQEEYIFHLVVDPEVIPERYRPAWEERIAKEREGVRRRRAMKEALALFERGEVEAAAEALERLIEAHPECGVAREARHRAAEIARYAATIEQAEESAEDGDYDAALEAYLSAEGVARRVGPRGKRQRAVRGMRADVYYARGRAAFERGDYEEAVADWLAVRVLDRGHEAAGEGLAELESMAEKRYGGIEKAGLDPEEEAEELVALMGITPRDSPLHGKVRARLLELRRSPPLPPRSAPIKELPDEESSRIRLATRSPEGLERLMERDDVGLRLSVASILSKRDDMALDERVRLILMGLEEEMRGSSYPLHRNRTYLTPKGHVKDVLTRALVRLGEDALPHLRDAMEDASPAVKESLVIARGMLGDDGVAQALRELLAGSSSEATRKGAAEALGRLGDRESIPLLIEALEDPFVGTEQGCHHVEVVFPVRARAAEALRSMGVELERRDEHYFEAVE